MSGIIAFIPARSAAANTPTNAPPRMAVQDISWIETSKVRINIVANVVAAETKCFFRFSFILSYGITPGYIINDS